MYEELKSKADQSPHDRRQWLQKASIAGASVIAGVAGFGVWHWQRQRAETPEQNGRSTDGLSALWALSLPGIDGKTIALDDFKGKPLLVNFWATWCPPCVTEMPLLQRFYDEMQPKGWQIVAIAVDQAPNVAKFVERTLLRFPIGIAGMEAIGLSRTLGNLGGGLPFSLVIASDGTLVQRKLGEIKEPDLANWRQIA
jgi:thiol-disulfide isomerase/thioredoxin